MTTILNKIARSNDSYDFFSPISLFITEAMSDKTQSALRRGNGNNN